MVSCENVDKVVNKAEISKGKLQETSSDFKRRRAPIYAIFVEYE